MKHALAIAILLAAGVANAQGFQDEPTCYSWEGGHKSAGSFTKCSSPWVVAKVPAPPVATPAVVATPLMPVCPPQITVIPEPKKAKPVIKRKPKPVTC